jgi:hypothetical protein
MSPTFIATSSGLFAGQYRSCRNEIGIHYTNCQSASKDNPIAIVALKVTVMLTFLVGGSLQSRLRLAHCLVKILKEYGFVFCIPVASEESYRVAGRGPRRQVLAITKENAPIPKDERFFLGRYAQLRERLGNHGSSPWLENQ